MAGDSSSRAVDISVVIPTFRRPKEIRETLQSVLCQMNVTLEVFVVDDCPDGSAREIVEDIADERVVYTRNPHPTGGIPSVVRNLAWPRTRGKFIHFLDDDDIVPVGHYAAVKAEFEQNPGIGLIFGWIEPFGDCPPSQLEHERRYFANAKQNGKRCNRFGAKVAFLGRALFGPAMLVCSAGVVRRECVAEVGGFDPGIRLFEDTDFFCRVIRACGARFTDRVTLHYRIGSPSLLHSTDPKPEQRVHEQEGARRIWTNYRRHYGVTEFLVLAAFARTILKCM